MAHFIVKGHIDAPIERLWEVATDFAHMAIWNVAVAEVKDLSGPMDRVGATATFMIKGPDRLHECHVEITAAERPRLLTSVGREAGAGGMEWTSTTRYTPAGGGTDTEWEQELKPPSGLLGAFTDKLFVQRTFERQMRQSSENFEETVKAKPAQPV